MDGYPTVETDLDIWASDIPSPSVQLVSTMLSRGLTVHANVAVRAEAERMVVLLPGAQDAKSQRRVTFFHRWMWQQHLPDVHVISLGDPSIAINERILGGWFMHPELDLIAELAAIVRRITTRLGVAPENVVFHGSSLGGFGAIGMAAHLKGASAISDIPQIDVQQCPVPTAIRRLEGLVGEPLSEFRPKHPERVDVLERLRYAKVVPPFTLVTNAEDRS